MRHSARINTLSENCTTLSATYTTSACLYTKTRNNHAKNIYDDTMNDFSDTISVSKFHNTCKIDAKDSSIFTMIRETVTEHVKDDAKDVCKRAMDLDGGANNPESFHKVMK